VNREIWQVKGEPRISPRLYMSGIAYSSCAIPSKVCTSFAVFDPGLIAAKLVTSKSACAASSKVPAVGTYFIRLDPMTVLIVILAKILFPLASLQEYTQSLNLASYGEPSCLLGR
jgi:hypothetical protein